METIVRVDAVGAGRFPSEIRAADIILEGYTVVEDVEPSWLLVEKLEFLPLIEVGQRPISGTDMRQLAKALNANLGLVDGIRIFAQKEMLPSGRFEVPFPGTVVMRTSDGSTWVLCLFRRDRSCGWPDCYDCDDTLVLSARRINDEYAPRWGYSSRLARPKAA